MNEKFQCHTLLLKKTKVRKTGQVIFVSSDGDLPIKNISYLL